MAERRRMPMGLLDPESERIAEAYAALPSVKKQTRGLLSLEPQPEQSTAQTAFEMLASFIPGVGQALAARNIERARRANDPAAAAMAATEFLPFGRLAGLGKKAGPVMSEIDVYHGSPHRFEEFDASKIGTGEGAQAYGHGIYLAEKPSTAEIYRRALAEDVISVNGRRIAAKRTPEARNDPETIAVDAIVSAHGGQYEDPFSKAIERLGGKYGPRNENYAKAMELAREWRGKGGKVEIGGNLYTADLPDEMVDRMLDWDKPLSEQPEVLKTLRESGLLQKAMKEGGFSQRDIDAGLMQGRHVLSASRSGKASESEALRGSGIPGIKYSDAGSRGQGGTGTRNFVVFPGEEKKVKIKKRE